MKISKKLLFTVIIAVSLLLFASPYITSAFFFINNGYVMKGEIDEGGNKNLTVAGSVNWLTGWQYRKSHTIINANGADVNYQIRIIVVNGTSEGVSTTYSTNDTITINNKTRRDFGDVRFTNSAGSLLNYWMESVNNGVSATFWVKIAGNLTSTNQTIYMYYGNSIAANISNGTNTFAFFDDFDDGTLDTNKWNNPHTVDAGTSVSESGGMLDFTLSGSYQYTGGSVISKTALPSGNYVAQTKLKFTNLYGACPFGAYAGFTNETSYDDNYYGNPSKLVSAKLWDCNNPLYLFLQANDIGNQGGTTLITVRNLWFRIQTVYMPTTYAKGIWTQMESPYNEITLEKSGTGGIVPKYVAVGIGDYITPEDTYFDYVFVRKYVSPEPSHGSWGDESQIVGGIAPITKVAVGQPVIGTASNATANLKICFGTFCTGIYQPKYSMNFTGNLSYSNGLAVSNSPITFTINYLNTQLEGTNSTDRYGNFFVKIDNLPEYMIEKDLNVTIKVESEVEAAYSCFYNYSLGRCCKQPTTTC